MAKRFQAFNPADGAETIAQVIVEAMRKAKQKEKSNKKEVEKKDGGK